MNSPDHRRSVLIAALSGRSLAELARKAGYRPLVADLFGDIDTRRHAHAVRVVRGNLTDGLEPDDLLAALADINAGETPIGLVCGAGFEQRPDILDKLAQKWELLGCSADVVRRVKDPKTLARVCAELDVPHPKIRFDTPDRPKDWLAKRVGGSGGWHICDATEEAPESGVYFQRRVAGEPIGALVVGTCHAARVIGWSSQWTQPAQHVPYRWAGAVQPAQIDSATEAAMSRKAIDLTVAAGIVGIASLDFLVDGRNWHFLEINPRPGGTLDIFDDGSGRLFAMHIEACRGSLIEPPRYRSAQASVIAFAERDVHTMADIDWPDWCADLQGAGTRVEADAPLCTIRGAADDAANARCLVEQRRRALLSMVHEPELAPC